MTEASQYIQGLIYHGIHTILNVVAPEMYYYYFIVIIISLEEIAWFGVIRQVIKNRSFCDGLPEERNLL